MVCAIRYPEYARIASLAWLKTARICTAKSGAFPLSCVICVMKRVQITQASG